MKKIILCLMFFVIVVSGVLLYKNFKNDNQEEKLGNQEEYVFSFDEKTILNEKIVVYNNNSKDYVLYHVIEFTGDKYILYNYYFMKNKNDYIRMYQELIDYIADYNYSQYMIKVVNDIDYGTYDEYMESIQEFVDEDNLYIVY